jgi:hypothetical protein
MMKDPLASFYYDYPFFQNKNRSLTSHQETAFVRIRGALELPIAFGYPLIIAQTVPTQWPPCE